MLFRVPQDKFYSAPSHIFSNHLNIKHGMSEHLQARHQSHIITLHLLYVWEQHSEWHWCTCTTLQNPLRRVSIEEIGEDPDESRRKAVQERTSTQSDAKQKITQHDQKLFEQFTKSENTQDKTDEKPKIETLEESVNDSEELKLNLAAVHIDDDSQPVKDKRPVVKSPVSSQQSTPTTSPRVPPTPTTSFQFQADWKSLRNHDQPFYQYFKVNCHPTAAIIYYIQSLPSSMSHSCFLPHCWHNDQQILLFILVIIKTTIIIMLYITSR